MSSDSTPNLNLPFILPAQAQKHVTHNESLRRLDAIIHLSVVSDELSNAPSNVNDSDRFIVAEGAGGEWAGQDGKIAFFTDGFWDFVAPQTGWLCHRQNSGSIAIWTGTEWTPISTGDGGDISDNLTLSNLGINAIADNDSRLNISSSGSLFNHDGASHRMRINKKNAQDTASVIFQSDFSGRAEFGLTGSEDFSINTSPDGINFTRSIEVGHTDGKVSFPQGIIHRASGHPIANYIPSPVKEIWRLDQSRAATPRTYVLQAAAGTTLTLTENLAHTIFSAGMRDNVMVRLWNMSKTPHESCWVNYDNSGNQVNVSDPAHISGWSNNDILQLGDPMGTAESELNVLGMVALDISPYLFNQLGTVFRQRALTLVTRAHADSGVGRVGLSATGEGGSAFDGYSLSDGQANNASFITPCSIKSPVSDSNILYLRESLDSGSSHLTNFVRLLGIWS